MQFPEFFVPDNTMILLSYLFNVGILWLWVRHVRVYLFIWCKICLPSAVDHCWAESLEAACHDRYRKMIPRPFSAFWIKRGMQGSLISCPISFSYLPGGFGSFWKIAQKVVLTIPCAHRFSRKWVLCKMSWGKLDLSEYLLK